MNYQINEGKLQLPDHYTDESINIIKLPIQQASLVITRTILKDKQTEEDYFLKQIAALKKNMKRFMAGDRLPTLLGCHSAFETQLQFEQKGVTLHQFLLTAQLPNTQQLLVFTYAQARALTETDKQYWQALKASFVLTE